jgi:hypothetical protein
MQYFKLRNSLNSKIIGKYFQSSDAKHNCNVWDEPKFIEHTNLKEITFEPIVSNAIIAPKAKVTDLISSSSIGFSRKLLISGKFKHVLQENVHDGIQFFQAPIIYKGDIMNDYWLVNAYPAKTDKLDFEKSLIIARKRKEGGGTYVVEEKVSSFSEFIEKSEFYWNNKIGQLLIRTMVFQDNVTDNFMTIDNTEGGVAYVVSEGLKQKIEDAGCTGIEFQHVEISNHDWLSPDGGEREKIYGKAK